MADGQVHYGASVSHPVTRELSICGFRYTFIASQLSSEFCRPKFQPSQQPIDKSVATAAEIVSAIEERLTYKQEFNLK